MLRVAILGNWHISISIFTRIARYPCRNDYENVLIHKYCMNSFESIEFLRKDYSESSVGRSWKTTKDQTTTIWETFFSRHHGCAIENKPETPQHYGIEGFKTGPQYAERCKFLAHPMQVSRSSLSAQFSRPNHPATRPTAKTGLEKLTSAVRGTGVSRHNGGTIKHPPLNH